MESELTISYKPKQETVKRRYFVNGSQSDAINENGKSALMIELKMIIINERIENLHNSWSK